MNKKVSNKIVYLNFILAFLILNLHSAYMELFDQQIINGSMTVRRSGIEMLCLMQSGMVTAKALPRK